MRLLVTALVAFGLLLSGCGGDSDKPEAAETKTATPTPSASPTLDVNIDCNKDFSRAEAVILAAEDLAPAEPEPFSGLTACRWTSSTSGAWVQVLAVPASEWASILPAAIGSVLDSELELADRDKLESALKLIQGGGKLDDTAACGIFGTMVSSLQGMPAGTTKVFNYVPTESAPQAINGQACLDGQYYSVQLASTNLTRSPAVEKRIKHALAILIK